MDSTSRRLMIIAGEASGDTLAGELVMALRATGDAWEFFGAGGEKMRQAGIDLSLDLARHAVVGIWEVLKNYGKFKGFFDLLLAMALERRPDVVVLVDYPGFNLRFAKALRELARQTPGWNVRVVYYVSPQIWAWHESRVHQIARDVDLLLSIFPFEKKWYARREPGLRVEFVGHPMIDRYKDHSFTTAPATHPLVLLLPGSRVRELKKHVPVLAGAARLMGARQNATFRMVVSDERLAKFARELMAGESTIDLTVGRLAEHLSRASVALASSGTVTMECAFFRVPAVVIYKTSWSTYQLGRRFIKVKYLAMPNVLADREIYPEFIQDAATAENIANAGLRILTSPEERRKTQLELGRVVESLGGPGAATRAAAAVNSLFNAT
jgi:lipid-A-disaccharide synthase